MTQPETTPEELPLNERLSRRFKASEVDVRDGFHYVAIDATINRFNEVLGFAYSFTINTLEVTKLEGELTRSGKQQYRVDAFGHVTIPTQEFGPVSRAGSGSAVNFDVDNAIKTAQAEVFKKAGHQFKVGLYLWDERERALVDQVKSGKFKSALVTLAGIKGCENLTDPEAIAATLDAKVEHLSKEETQRALLAEAGLL